MIVEDKKAIGMVCCGPTSLIKCQGSFCMAWRWAVEKVLVKAEDPEDVALEYYTHVQSTTHGYCGLAGRP